MKYPVLRGNIYKKNIIYNWNKLNIQMLIYQSLNLLDLMEIYPAQCAAWVSPILCAIYINLKLSNTYVFGMSEQHWIPPYKNVNSEEKATKLFYFKGKTFCFALSIDVYEQLTYCVCGNLLEVTRWIRTYIAVW